MNKKMLISGSVVLVALTSAITYALTYNIAMNKFNKVVSEVNERQTMYKKLSDIDQTVRQDYIGDILEDDILNGISKGYVLGLNNPKVKYLDQEFYKDYVVSCDPKSIFIGIEPQKNDKGNIEVLYVNPNSLAKQADIIKGDVIVSINDFKVEEIGYSNAINKLYGMQKDKVVIKLNRTNSEGKTEELVKTIKFKQTKGSSIESRIINENIGYIKLTRFDYDIKEVLSNTLKELENNDAAGFILDLRDTTGGDYDSMAKAADMLLPKGDIISVVDKAGTKEVKYRSAEDEFDYPLMVLVNDGTSGPAEILASSLKDYKKAKVIGEKTQGNCEQFKNVQLSDGSGIVVPVGHYVTNESGIISSTGLEPSIKVGLAKDLRASLKQRQLELGKDSQMQEAIKQLKDIGV